MRATRFARGAYWWGRSFPARVRPWRAARRSLGVYRVLDEPALRATRRSDTVFVFGSGASLNDLRPDELTEIARHDTLGFNWFVHQDFLRCDYHLVRGIPDTDLDPAVWRPQVEEYCRLIRESPRFHDTVFLVQTGFRATNGNRVVGLRLLPEGARIFLWRTNTRAVEPGETFADGLTHGHSTLQECINFAFLLGWREIVLVGVDLYDRRYFWLPGDEARSVDVRRGAAAGDPHHRAASGMVATLGAWRRWLERRGVRLSVYNPRSLLAAELPVFRLDGR